MLKKTIKVSVLVFLGFLLIPSFKALTIRNVDFSKSELKVIHSIGITNEELLDMDYNELVELKNIDSSTLEIKYFSEKENNDVLSKSLKSSSNDYTDLKNRSYTLSQYYSNKKYYARIKVSRNGSDPDKSHQWNFLGLTYLANNESGEESTSTSYTRLGTTSPMPATSIKKIRTDRLVPFNAGSEQAGMAAFKVPSTASKYSYTYKKEFSKKPSHVCFGHYSQENSKQNVIPNHDDIFVLKNGFFIWDFSTGDFDESASKTLEYFEQTHGCLD